MSAWASGGRPGTQRTPRSSELWNASLPCQSSYCVSGPGPVTPSGAQQPQLCAGGSFHAAARGQPGMGGCLVQQQDAACSSHVAGLPSCHRRNDCRHGWGVCSCGDPLVASEPHRSCCSLPGRGCLLPVSKTAVIPIRPGGWPTLQGQLSGAGSACSPTAGSDLGRWRSKPSAFLGMALGSGHSQPAETDLCLVLWPWPACPSS